MAKPSKREKVFHPDSRKAAQATRIQLRKTRLSESASVRKQRLASQVDVYAFVYHALPAQGVFLLEELHSFIRDVWLTRHDEEVQRLDASRRKGRPKTTRQLELEEIKHRESEEYRTGMEVLDLTHAANVELFRQWDQTQVAYVQMLRFIRIMSTNPSVAIVSKPGNHPSLS